MRTTATVAVLFCDVVGSTERLTRMGDEAGDQFRRSFFAALRRAVVDHDGTEVKHLGDGLMVVFEHSTIGAIECAAAMHAAARDFDPDDPVHLRIGVSIGEVAHEDDDWFGTPVVEAARLCAAAGSDRTLAPALLESIVGSRGRAHHFRPIGPMSLKGLPPGMQVVEVDGPDAPEGELVPPTWRESEHAAAEGEPRRRWTVLVAGLAIMAAVAIIATVVITDGDGTDVDSREVDDRSHGGLPTSDVVTAPEGYSPKLVQLPQCSQATLELVPTATCSELVVPESRANPEGRKLRLPVVSVEGPAGSDVDPVVVLDVNEGAATALAETADVHLLGLRGFHTTSQAGGDLPSHSGTDPVLRCPELEEAWVASLALDADDPAGIDARVSAAGACSDRLRAEGIQLEGYSWAEAADDIRDLVWASNLEKVNVASGGLTTVSAVAFARANPGYLSSMILTNPTPPGESVLEDPTLSLSRSFDRIVELCRAETRCNEKHPDLAQQYEDRYRELEDHPVTVSTTSLTGVGPFTVRLDGRRYAAALESAMRESSRLPQIPSAVAGASDELTAAAGISEDVSFFAGPSLAGAFLSLTCSYDASTNRTAEVSDTAMAMFAGANEPSFGRICERWDVPDEFGRLSRPLDVDIPVLLASGGLSASGVNGWAELMAEGLDRATVVIVPTMSEDLAFSPPVCMKRLRAQFLVDPSADLRADDCQQQSTAIDFVA